MTRAFYNPRLPCRQNSEPPNTRLLNSNSIAYQNTADQAVADQVPICEGSAPNLASNYTSNTLPPHTSNAREMDNWDMSSDNPLSSTGTLVSDAGISIAEEILSRATGCKEDEDMADIDEGGDEDLVAFPPY